MIGGSLSLRRVLMALVRVYQNVSRPFWRIIPWRQCRFWPSCSEYFHEALDCYGASKGTLLFIKRISRCYWPWPGGYDPVPCSGSFAPAEEPGTDCSG